MEAELKIVLTSLKEYQEVLVRISELDNLLSVVPPEIENLEQEWKAILARIAELEARTADQEHQITEKERALEEARSKSQKFEKDLHVVTNNKEYPADHKELDLATTLLHALTAGLHTRRAELAEIEINMDESVQLAKESKQKWEAAMRAHQESQTEHKHEREEKISLRGELAKTIPDRLMNQFNRIAERRNGVGLAICLSAVCLACNVRIRQSIVDQLRRHDRIINCESCKRILYFADGD